MTGLYDHFAHDLGWRECALIGVLAGIILGCWISDVLLEQKQDDDQARIGAARDYLDFTTLPKAPAASYSPPAVGADPLLASYEEGQRRLLEALNRPDNVVELDMFSKAAR